MKTLKTRLLVALFFVFGLFALPAFAVPPATLADLTAGIAFTDVGLAILAIAFALSGIAVTWLGAKTVLRVLGWRF